MDATDSGPWRFARSGQNEWSICVGRRNWLFSDTQGGAKASANLYSIVQCAKLNGLEPYAYLRHIFTDLPKATSLEDIEALLPARVKLPTTTNP